MLISLDICWIRPRPPSRAAVHVINQEQERQTGVGYSSQSNNGNRSFCKVLEYSIQFFNYHHLLQFIYYFIYGGFAV